MMLNGKDKIGAVRISTVRIGAFRIAIVKVGAHHLFSIK
jgi:hypothetical protein